jgi:hypothetical protein
MLPRKRKMIKVIGVILRCLRLFCAGLLFCRLRLAGEKLEVWGDLFLLIEFLYHIIS